MPPGRRPEWPRGKLIQDKYYVLASPESDTSEEPGLLAAMSVPFSGDRDVMTRQILFRKNDYCVIRDGIDAITDSQWRLSLLARNAALEPGRALVKGWLGVDSTISIFHVQAGSDVLKPVAPSDMSVERQRHNHLRLTVRLPAGAGVVAVLDFHRAGEVPWRVSTKDNLLILASPDGRAEETVEMTGRGEKPTARWERREEGGQSAAWAFVEN